ncbi:cytochrome P450 [Mycobacterium antarcticum]|nr:cytochrome P450 [Mycolicibacterium sp. TUM20985]
MLMLAQNLALRWHAARGDALSRVVSSKADPFPLYEQIRAGGTLVRSSTGMWATASHQLCQQILRDGRFVVEGQSNGTDAPELSLLELDPPDHTRLRRLAAPAFRPRLVAGYEQRMQAVADALLDDIDPRGFDLVDEFAWPLPITVITDVLGVDNVDHITFAKYGKAVADSLSGVTSTRQARELRAATDGLSELFTDLMDRRRRAPRDDLMSQLVVAHDGDVLTVAELIALCQLLLVAGFETTVNLIGSAVAMLLDHSDQWSALVADPSLAVGAVEETLRHQAPVQVTSRIAATSVELAGNQLPKGSIVALLIGGANRDPLVFNDPHRFDISRAGGPEHLAFSSGIHYCLGANLARREGAVALRTLATRMPSLRRNGADRYRTGYTIRGLLKLPVTT